MGSYINIGIVYTDKNIIKIDDDLVAIIKYLSPFCNNIVVNYPIMILVKTGMKNRLQEKKDLLRHFRY